MDKGEINLSFVLTTFNKNEYLKFIMPALLKAIKNDEELIVVDGGSSDGSIAYLLDLFNRKLIQQFVSEPDLGEGHGFNKGILLAKGKLIKLLSDDDVFYFDEIRKCKEYMLSHPGIDFLNTHGGWYDLHYNSEIAVFTKGYINDMRVWIESGKPFTFCMLGVMINKSSLALLGLLNPSIKRTDAEYGLRVTSLKMKMAWYTGICYVRILNTNSNSVAHQKKIFDETKRLNSFYNVSIDGPQEVKGFTDKIKDHTSSLAKRILRRIKRALFGRKIEVEITGTNTISFEEGVNNAYKWMIKENEKSDREFITN